MATRKHKHVKYAHPGKPTVITADIIVKLEDAFRNAFTDEMACVYAGIGARTLYDFCKTHPEFAQRKEELKIHPNMKAQTVIVKDLDNVSGARYWAERRMKDFMPTQAVVLGGKVETEDTTAKQAIKDVASRFEEELKRTIASSHKKI